MCKKKRTGENGIKFNDKGEKSMKDTNSTTENITTKEENVMNEELLKIKGMVARIPYDLTFN